MSRTLSISMLTRPLVVFCDEDMRRTLTLLLFAIPAILTLRWPLPIALATLRGEGAVDRTVLAFLAPFVLMLVGLPGYLAAAAGARPQSRLRLLLRRAGTLFVLLSALLVLLWMSPAVMQMATTLRRPLSNAVWIAPPLATMVLSVVARQRLRTKPPVLR